MIKPDDLRAQYRDASNLQARAAIYHYGSKDVTPWPRWVFEQLDGLPPDARVLEIGCGYGGLWKANLDRVPAGWRVVLMDLSPGMAKAAREATHFSSAVADAASLPVQNAAFDAVVANHMLYHVPDDLRPAALREIRRVLKPGGKLFAATNGEGHIAAMMKLVVEFIGELSLFSGARPFTLENGERQLEAVFKQVKVNRQRDELRIPAVQPVVDYVMSCHADSQAIVGPRMSELRATIDALIQRDGAFIVATDAGVFIATS